MRYITTLIEEVLQKHSNAVSLHHCWIVFVWKKRQRFVGRSQAPSAGLEKKQVENFFICGKSMSVVDKKYEPGYFMICLHTMKEVLCALWVQMNEKMLLPFFLLQFFKRGYLLELPFPCHTIALMIKSHFSKQFFWSYLLGLARVLKQGSV